MQYSDLMRRIAFDAQMLGSSFLTIRSGLASKLAAALGVACVFMPFDLIPNRLPIIGHADEISYVVIGLIISFQLLPLAYKEEFRSEFAPRTTRASLSSSTPVASWLDSDFKVIRSAALRFALLQGIAAVVARPFLRLTIGRWPGAADVAAFQRSFAHFTPIPPLLRALACVPAARHQLMRTMLISWMQAEPTYKAELKAELGSATPVAGDQLEVWLGRPVAFLHLEKTAGMSLASFLTSRFHPLQIDPDPDRVFPPHVKRPFPEHVVERVRRYPLVWGHYDLPSIRRLGDSRFVFTVLREPKARILSLYQYWRSHGSLYLGRDGSNGPVLAAQSFSLLEFLQTDDPVVRNHIDNFYVRRLTGVYETAGKDPLMTDTDNLLQVALDALGSVDFVGITEDMIGTMAILGKLLDFEPPVEVPYINRTRLPNRSSNGSGEEMTRCHSPLVLGELARLTRMDDLIYEAACERFFRFRVCVDGEPNRAGGLI